VCCRYVFRDTDPEEPLPACGLICDFHDLEVWDGDRWGGDGEWAGLVAVAGAGAGSVAGPAAVDARAESHAVYVCVMCMVVWAVPKEGGRLRNGVDAAVDDKLLGYKGGGTYTPSRPPAR